MYEWWNGLHVPEKQAALEQVEERESEILAIHKISIK